MVLGLGGFLIEGVKWLLIIAVVLLIAGVHQRSHQQRTEPATVTLEPCRICRIEATDRGVCDECAAAARAARPRKKVKAST